MGSAHIDYARAFAGLSPDAEILFYARLPRVLLALLAGGALAVAGTLFQALLRDALATPYTLGVSSGASLGAVIAISLGLAADRRPAGDLGGGLGGRGEWCWCWCWGSPAKDGGCRRSPCCWRG